MARYYDSSMGRFLNEDTVEGQIDNPLSQNLYTYVINNPLLYSDPTGHMHAQDAGWGGFAGNNYSAMDPVKVWSGPVVDVMNFMILDDINTLRDPNSSGLAKSSAAAGFLPIESIIKEGKLIVKLLTKEGKTIEKEFELIGEVLSASKKLDSSSFVCPALVVSDEKFGQKLIQHLRDDWGLDPSVAANRDWIKKYAIDIHQNYDEVRVNLWRGIKNGEEGPALFYRKGNEVIVTDLQGGFVTLLKDGATQNSRFLGGAVLGGR